MKIALAQIDSLNGDVEGNAGRILEAMEQARDGGADLCVFPELALVGYACYDLLLQPELAERACEATRAIARQTSKMAVILGTVEKAGTGPDGLPRMYNTAAVLQGGRIIATRAKTLLPSYNVFHETRYFRPASYRAPIEVNGKRIGILICEDMWDAPYDVHPAAELRAAGAEMLIVLSASPYRLQVAQARLENARRHGMPLVYVNGVGAQDELVFDGGSFVLDQNGARIASLPKFSECVSVVDMDAPAGPMAPPVAEEEEMFNALVAGVRGFFAKNRLKRAFLGLSGGVDSALVACIAAEALGADHVHALAIPSRYTDPESTKSARELAHRLGISFQVALLEPLQAAAEKLLEPLLHEDRSTTAENIQCRLRSLILMAHVNRYGGLLLNTSNKTELSLGYGTLYGDLAGGFSPLGDLLKTDVYRLAGWYNGRNAVIPKFILNRAPSAELRPDQTDPFDYPHVAPGVEAMIEGASREELLQRGVTLAEIERWTQLLQRAEHKRWQAPVVLKVRPVSFGRGRLIPITRRTDPAEACAPVMLKCKDDPQGPPGVSLSASACVDAGSAGSRIADREAALSTGADRRPAERI